MVLEAIAAGVPIVASRTGGIPTQVHDHQDALLVEPGNPAALACTLVDALSDRAGAAARAASAQHRLVQSFQLSDMVDAIEAVYRSVAGPSQAVSGAVPADVLNVEREAAAAHRECLTEVLDVTGSSNDSGVLATLRESALLVRDSVAKAVDWDTPGGRAEQYHVDLVADAVAVEFLTRAGLDVLSEESGRHVAGSGVTVIVDPIDGSSNTIRGLPWFATSPSRGRSGRCDRSGRARSHARDSLRCPTHRRGSASRRRSDPSVGLHASCRCVRGVFRFATPTDWMGE